MTRLPACLGLLGVALATGLILWRGLDVVASGLAAAGLGLLWASAFHAIPMLLNTCAWRVVLPGARQISFVVLAWVFWIRESINGLLPVARLGGEAVAAGMLIRRGGRPASVIGSLVVRLTLTLLTQVVFTLLGLLLLLAHATDRAAAARLGLLLPALAAILAVLLGIQRLGLFGLGARLIQGRFPITQIDGIRVDRVVRRLYRRRGAILRSCLWQMGAWVAGAGEIWLVLHFLGHSRGMAEAFLLESLSQAISTAAFLIPAAIGAQEAGFVGLGHLIGMPPDVALTLALSRRVRDLVVYGPGLLAWQTCEFRRLRADARSPRKGRGLSP
jgi:putative membrane protein